MKINPFPRQEQKSCWGVTLTFEGKKSWLGLKAGEATRHMAWVFRDELASNHVSSLGPVHTNTTMCLTQQEKKTWSNFLFENVFKNSLFLNEVWNSFESTFTTWFSVFWDVVEKGLATLHNECPHIDATHSLATYLGGIGRKKLALLPINWLLPASVLACTPLPSS